MIANNQDRFAAYEGGGRMMGGKPSTPANAVRPSPAVAHVPKPAQGLDVGTIANGDGLGLDLAQLLVGRLLIQGVSGAGKSWALRRLMEQAAGQVQLIVIDPEGEFASLAGVLGILHIAGHQLSRAAIFNLAQRVRQHRLSIVLDLSEQDRAGQMATAAVFLQALIDAPREHWHPCLVAIDEAHLFAPFGGHSAADSGTRKAAIGAVVDLMGRGRKRGLAGVLATQRLARLAKSVSSEVQNFLIGLNTMDLDIKRAAEQIGWDHRKAFDRLPVLQPGEFIVVGRAFSHYPVSVKVGPVVSRHIGAAPKAEAPPAASVDAARETLGLAELLAESEAEEQADVDSFQTRGTRAVREFVRDPAFPVAARVLHSLKAVAPEGTTLKALAKYLDVDLDQVGFALSLLDQFGMVEFGEDKGQGRPVAIDRNFAKGLVR